MGNETSQLAGLEVDEKAVEVTDFWAHHTAVFKNDNFNEQRISVFIGEPLVGVSHWITNSTPLEVAAKNLKIYRHPYILKYISSWKRGSKYFLAVEEVKPLSHVLASQSMLQICMGLLSILKALIFLHETGVATHNNICTSSIYVTQEGTWKLGGLEFLCKFNDLSQAYLSKTSSHRYEKAIDPKEKTLNLKDNKNVKSIDAFAFAILVLEVLNDRNNEEIAGLKLLKDLCKNEMQSANIKLRPNLNDLLNHPFFNHDFIKIHSFLNDLLIKSDMEKAEFFTCLVDKLRKFPEKAVASQLGGLLLSRLVLLDQIAQKDVLPFILEPKIDNSDSAQTMYQTKLFSKETFATYIIPKLMKIFSVRDTQIRLVLLAHLKKFLPCFTKDQLIDHILPELLLGIKDTNDELVAITLQSLADLIPVLGSQTVIGGTRSKIFSDGRPLSHSNKRQNRRSLRRHSDLRVPSLPMLQEIPSVEESESVIPSASNIIITDSEVLDLTERPSPDGGEDTEVKENQINEIDDDWSDWDAQENLENDDSVSDEILVKTNEGIVQFDEIQTSGKLVDEIQTSDSSSFDSTMKKMFKIDKNPLPDILELDIKNQKTINGNSSDEFDFFQDMEPVIEKTSKFVIDEKLKSDLSFGLKMTSDYEMEEDGWGDDLKLDVD